MLSPDKVLLVRRASDLHPAFTPTLRITVPNGDEGEAEEPTSGEAEETKDTTLTPQSAHVSSPYAFQFDEEDGRWHLRFPGDRER